VNERILIVDDDDALRESLELVLAAEGYAVRSVASGVAALAAVEQSPFDLVLCDLRMPGMDGMELLPQLARRLPGVAVILMSAYGSADLAVEALRRGAYDYLAKPFQPSEVVLTIRKARERERLRLANQILRRDLQRAVGDRPIVAASQAMIDVLEVLERAAEFKATVLLTGESGTGKEVLAEFLHRNSPRRAGPLVKVNLGGIPRSLFESEMFGHRKGAFTDAHQDRQGRFALATGGTILLDEIGELDAACQVKMLRVLQERTFEMLGDSRTRNLDVRVISATNRDLEGAVRDGRFREDLYYRVNLITLHLPRLEDRREDIPLLARHFARGAALAFDRPGLTVTDDAARWLAGRPWPGNVRQLRHFVERTALVADHADLTLEDVRRTWMIDESRRGETPGDWAPPVGSMTVEEMERAMIVKSLGHHDGNLSRVAESLGLSRAALYRRLEKFGIRT
jgi:DNA-binding NtrC family response regulator